MQRAKRDRRTKANANATIVLICRECWSRYIVSMIQWVRVRRAKGGKDMQHTKREQNIDEMAGEKKNALVNLIELIKWITFCTIVEIQRFYFRFVPWIRCHRCCSHFFFFLSRCTINCAQLFHGNKDWVLFSRVWFQFFIGAENAHNSFHIEIID